MAGFVTIEGQAELLAEMRRAEDATPREFAKTLRAGSELLKARMVQLAPRGQREHTDGVPHIVDSLAVFSTQKTGGVRSSAVHAGVQEFAKQYRRRSRNPSLPGHTVTMHGPPPPRFGYKALDELADTLTDLTAEALYQLLASHGWLGE